MHFVFEPQQAQNLAPVSGIVVAIAVDAFGQAQISLSGQGGKEIEALEYKPNLAPANVGALGVGRRGHIFSGDHDAALRRRQQTAEQMQHG